MCCCAVHVRLQAYDDAVADLKRAAELEPTDKGVAGGWQKHRVAVYERCAASLCAAQYVFYTGTALRSASF